MWHEARVPDGLGITQVYGYLLCPRTGRVLVQDDDGVFNLPGGTPEPEDGGDLVATLVREAFEENQVRVGATAYLGYQEVHRPGRVVYAQVRMAGVIEEFAPRAPDLRGEPQTRCGTARRASEPDTGRVFPGRASCRRRCHSSMRAPITSVRSRGSPKYSAASVVNCAVARNRRLRHRLRPGLCPGYRSTVDRK